MEVKGGSWCPIWINRDRGLGQMRNEKVLLKATACTEKNYLKLESGFLVHYITLKKSCFSPFTTFLIQLALTGHLHPPFSQSKPHSTYTHPEDGGCMRFQNVSSNVHIHTT
jgi:hypothetical protein